MLRTMGGGGSTDTANMSPLPVNLLYPSSLLVQTTLLHDLGGLFWRGRTVVRTLKTQLLLLPHISLAGGSTGGQTWKLPCFSRFLPHPLLRRGGGVQYYSTQLHIPS
jgi:hypothetical protein